MARLTRVESQARTRAQLLDAAAGVFARRGFHGASLEEVAEQAGYTRGAVYSNFSSKDELFLAVLQERMRGQVEFVADLCARAQASDELAEVLPDLDWMDMQWCLLLFEFWLYALRNPAAGERLAELYREYRGDVASLPAVSGWSGGGLTPHELAGATIALYQGLALQRHIDPDAVRADVVGRLLGALGVGGE